MEKLYTVKEVADILKLKEITIRQWMSRGQLQFIKIGGGRTVRITQQEIDRMTK